MDQVKRPATDRLGGTRGRRAEACPAAHSNRHQSRLKSDSHQFQLPRQRYAPNGFDEMTSARTNTAQRPSAAITRSNSSQYSWLPPAARKTSRIVCGTSRPSSAPSTGPTRRAGPDTATHWKLDLNTRVACFDQANSGSSVDWVVNNTGTDDRSMHGPISPNGGTDSEIVVSRS
jgi:hypothetical protein